MTVSLNQLNFVCTNDVMLPPMVFYNVMGAL